MITWAIQIYLIQGGAPSMCFISWTHQLYVVIQSYEVTMELRASLVCIGTDHVHHLKPHRIYSRIRMLEFPKSDLNPPQKKCSLLCATSLACIQSDTVDYFASLHVAGLLTCWHGPGTGWDAKKGDGCKGSAHLDPFRTKVFGGEIKYSWLKKDHAFPDDKWLVTSNHWA